MFDLMRRMRRSSALDLQPAVGSLEAARISDAVVADKSHGVVRRGQALVEFGHDAVVADKSHGVVRRGQALVEFGMVFAFLTMLIIGGAAVMLTLFQTWSVERSVNELGSMMAMQGVYDEDVRTEFLARGAALGFIPNPETDSLLITLTKPDGELCDTDETCEFSWDDEVSMNYGDMISVRIVSPVQFPATLNWMDTLLGNPNAAASWTGIAQRNGGDAATNPHPSTSGALRGRVTSAVDGSPLADVILTLDTGVSVVSDSQGYYHFNTVPTGGHTVQASKAGYQNSIVDVVIPANTTISLNLQLTSVSRLAILVLDPNGSNLMSEPGIEDITGWAGTGSVFTSSTNLTHTAAAASAEDFGARLNSTSGGSPNQGATYSVPGQFVPGQKYLAFAWVRAPSGISIDIILGQNNSDRGLRSFVGNGEWMPMWTTWTPISTVNTPLFVIRTTSASSVNAIIDFDEVIVADASAAEIGATVTTEDGLVATEYVDGLYELSLDSVDAHVVRATNSEGNRTGGLPIQLAGAPASSIIIQMDVDPMPEWTELVNGDPGLVHWWRLNEDASNGVDYAARILAAGPVAYYRMSSTEPASETDYAALVAAGSPTHYWPLDEDHSNYEQALFAPGSVAAYFPFNDSGSPSADVISGNSLVHDRVTSSAHGATWDPGIAFDADYDELVLARPGLVHYWPLDGTAAGTGAAPDLGPGARSGNVLGGTGGGHASLVATSNGTTRHFDGGDDEIDIGSNGSLFSGSISWEAWLRPLDVSKDQMFLTYGAQTANYFRIFNGKLFASFNISGSGQQTITGTTNLVNNQVYHVIAEYNAGNGGTKIYLNGVQDAYKVLPTGGVVVSSQTCCVAGAGNQIGRWRDGDPRAYRGYIDNVAIYNNNFGNAAALARYQAGIQGASLVDTTISGLPTGATPRTVNFWWRSSRTTEMAPFGYGSAATRQGFSMLINNSGTDRVTLWTYNDNSTIEMLGLSDGKWHMITMSYNGANQISAYMDGAYVGGHTTAAPLATGTAKGLILGRRYDEGSTISPADDAYMDDLVIWSKQLSQAEITAIYAAAQSTPRHAINSSTGLLAYFGLDEPSVAASGCTSATSYTSVLAQYCGIPAVNQTPLTSTGDRSVLFDGVNDEVDYTLPSGSTRVSVSAWIKPTNVSKDQMIMSFGGILNYLRILPDGRVTYAQNIGGTQRIVESTMVLENDRIYHIAARYDGTQQRLYINGELQASSTFAGDAIVSACALGANQYCELGRWYDGDVRGYVGYLDEVAIWNRSISETEITAIYNGGRQLFADTAGDADLHVFGRMQDQQPALARIGSTTASARFRDSGALAEYGGNTLDLSGNNPYTFEAWIKPEELPAGGNSYYRIISSETLLNRTGSLLVYNLSGNITFERWNNGTGVLSTLASPGSTMNRWTHVVGTYDGSVMNLYLNGGLAATASGTTPIGTYRAPIGVGSISTNGSSGVFAGVIDEPAVYDRAITPAEVFEHYTVGMDLLAEESSGRAAATEGSTASGTVGFTTDGNTARDFDGTNDRAMAFVPEFTAGDKATIEWWGRWDAYSDNDDFWFELSPNINQISSAFYIDPNGSTGTFRVVLLCSPGNSLWYQTPRPGTSWMHYAVSVDMAQPAGSEVQIYFNGVAQPLTLNGTCDTTGSFASDTLYMMHRGGNQSLFGDGGLDEVAIYDRILGVNEVQSHYAAAVGLGFDDTHGAADDGVASNVAAGVTGAIGDGSDPAFSFSGAGQASVELPADITGTFTVEAWVKADNTNGGTYSIVSGRTADNQYGFNMSLLNGTSLTARIGDGITNLQTAASAPLAYQANTWYHVAYVITPDSWTAYANGNKIGSGALSGGTPRFSPGGYATIGSNGCTPTCTAPNAFVGDIDEVAIYNRALSAIDIATHYLSGTE